MHEERDSRPWVFVYERTDIATAIIGASECIDKLAKGTTREIWGTTVSY